MKTRVLVFLIETLGILRCFSWECCPPWFIIRSGGCWCWCGTRLWWCWCSWCGGGRSASEYARPSVVTCADAGESVLWRTYGPAIIAGGADLLHRRKEVEKVTRRPDGVCCARRRPTSFLQLEKIDRASLLTLRVTSTAHFTFAFSAWHTDWTTGNYTLCTYSCSCGSLCTYINQRPIQLRCSAVQIDNGYELECFL